MNKFTLKSLSVFVFSTVLMSCGNESEATAPLTINDSKYFGTAPGTCEVIEFEGNNTIEIGAGAVTTVYSEGTPVRIAAQLKSAKGVYDNANSAVLYNTSQPDSKNKNYITPNTAAIRPMGNVLTAGKTQGTSTSIYDKGSRIEMDFSEMGSITLNAIHVLDITADEAESTLELLDINDKIIKTYKLPVTGAYGATRLNTDATPGVSKIRVTFNGDGKRGASGAIDVLEFCRN
jgi:hypothetical protein